MKFIKRMFYEQRFSLFAPAYFKETNENRESLIVTAGKNSDKVFGTKTWQNGKVENWYKYGCSSFWLYEKKNLQWELKTKQFIDTSDFDDVMKLCVIKQNEIVYSWFSGLKNEVWNIYFCRIVNGIQEEIQEIIIDKTQYQSQHSFLPCVIFDSCFKLWYVGRDGKNRRILYAESTDGIHWINNQKVLDLGEFGEGDAYAVDCPDVIKLKTAYVMTYGGGTSRGIHVAFSANGIHWKKVGQCVFRGNLSEDTYNYSFYPCFMVDKKIVPDDLKDVSLIFAGEDANGNWSIQLYEDWGKFINEDFLHDGRMYDNWLETCNEINQIPNIYRCMQSDSNNTDFYYEDNKICQLKPSTALVFREKRRNIIYKFSLSRQNAENEMKACFTLGRQLNIVKKSIKYIDSENTVLLMPYIKNAMSLKELAQKDMCRFVVVYKVVLEDCRRIFIENLVDDSTAQISFTGQTPALLRQWCQNIIHRLESLQLTQLVSLRTHREYDLLNEFKKAQDAVEASSKKLVYFTGDPNMNNILVDPDNAHHYIDMEYLGFFDLDYVVAKLVGSFIKHCVPMSITEYYENGKLYIGYEEKSPLLKGMLNYKFYADIFSCVAVNYKRVVAFILIKLHFRIMELTNDFNEKNVRKQLMILLAALDFLCGEL